MQVTIYGKENCPNCVKAKTLCSMKKVQFNYLTFGIDYTKEELESKLGKKVSSVPQIFVDEEYVGDLKGLMEKLH